MPLLLLAAVAAATPARAAHDDRPLNCRNVCDKHFEAMDKGGWGSVATEIGHYTETNTLYLCCNCQLLLDRAFNNNKTVVGYIHYKDGLAVLSEPSAEQIGKCANDAKSADAQQTSPQAAERPLVPFDRGAPAGGDAARGFDSRGAHP